MSKCALALLDGDVSIAVDHRLAVLLDLDCVTIKNAHREMLPVEFDRPVGGRNPTLECGLAAASSTTTLM
jgi:hypothetical protein